MNHTFVSLSDPAYRLITHILAEVHFPPQRGQAAVYSIIIL